MLSPQGTQGTVLAVSFCAFLLTFGLLPSEARAQWAKTFGDPESSNKAVIAEQTTDGGYVVAGVVHHDFLVLKLSSDGELEWLKTYGGTEGEAAQSVVQTPEGGYVVTGTTLSFGAGGSDLLALKLSSSGTVEWSRVIGGSGNEGYGAPDFYPYIQPFRVRNASDGGYIIAGTTKSFGAGEDDWLVLKLSSSGAVEWKKTFGGPDDDACVSLEPTADGGYVTAGDYGAGGIVGTQSLIVKLASSGSIEWQKTYSIPHGINSIHPTSSQGYIAVGPGGGTFTMMRLSSIGDVQWTKLVSTNISNRVFSVREISDGGYILAGRAIYSGTTQSYYMIWKFNAVGEYEWKRSNGGKNDDALSVRETSDGGFMVAGYAGTYGTGLSDLLILRTDSNGLMPNCLGTLSATGHTIADGVPTVQSATVTETTPALTVGVPALTVTDVALTEKTCPFYVPPPPGGCSGVAEASTYETTAVFGASALVKHLGYLLLPMGAVIWLTIWRRKR